MRCIGTYLHELRKLKTMVALDNGSDSLQMVTSSLLAHSGPSPRRLVCVHDIKQAGSSGFWVASDQGQGLEGKKGIEVLIICWVPPLAVAMGKWLLCLEVSLPFSRECRSLSFQDPQDFLYPSG
jgi:hypothetical protein